jgi:hypothetical protein
MHACCIQGATLLSLHYQGSQLMNLMANSNTETTVKEESENKQFNFSLLRHVTESEQFQRKAGQ